MADDALSPEDLDVAWTGQDDEVKRLRASAVIWSRRAAAFAVGRYEIDDGIALLRRAADLEPDPSRQGELWYEIGHANALKYDGEAFVAAMERALQLGAPKGEVYAELAHQTVHRAGMWQRRLDDSLIEGWIEAAMAHTTEGTPARVRALAEQAEVTQQLRPLATAVGVPILAVLEPKRKRLGVQVIR